MSAKEYLYISYIGRNSKDGSLIPASSIVDELISYVGRALQMDMESIIKKLVTAHPLHGFSQQYFVENGLVNYLSEDCYKSKSNVGEKLEKDEPTTVTEIKLQDLILFLQNPPKYFLTKKLGIYYKEQDELIPEHEIFEFDNLTKWGINNDLIYVPDSEIANELRKKKLLGSIPLANMGEALIKELDIDLNEVKSIYQNVIRGKQKAKVDVDMIIGNIAIKGWIDQIFDNDYVYVCNSSDVTKHILAAYIQFLILRSQDGKYNLIFIKKHDCNQHVIEANCITQEAAIEVIEKILAFLQNAETDYFHFYPKLLEDKKMSDNYEAFISTYEEAIENDRNYDFNDAYLQKAVENGFFDEEVFGKLTDNVKSVLGVLPQTFRDLINPSKK
jgi:exodeoxyribonuclease V gamma subunit